MSSYKINPDWLKFNEAYNEGGEGFNPHGKWLPNNNKTSSTMGQKKVMYNGQLKAKSELEAILTDAKMRFSKVSSRFAIQIWSKVIKDVTELLNNF